jgi:EmrB/QacA subfamily drug resistance transporter
MADISGNAKAQPVGKFVIVALAMGQVLVSLDATAMNIALPTVQNDLGASSSSLQLIIVSYMIASAACTLPIAAISDRVGRKRMYTGGLLSFIFGSGLCAIAWSTQILVIARVIQGIGAAAIFGLALAILTANVDRARVPKIVAVWMTVSTVAFSAGPFVGGVLVSLFGWRSVFFINMPLTVLVLTVAVAALPNDRKIINERPNLTGGVLIALTLSMFTWAIISIQQSGFMSPQVLLSFLFSCVLLAVLIFEQRHTDDPLVQWDLLKRSPIPASLALNLLLGLALSGAQYQMSIFTQNVLGYSAALAGTITLSATVMMAALAPVAPKLQYRLGAARPAMIAFLITGLGMLLLGMSNPSSTISWIVLGLSVLGIGLAIADPIVSSVAMQNAEESNAGAVSGSLGLMGQVGATLGITLMGGLTTSVALSHWHSGNGDPVLDTLVGVGDVSGVEARGGKMARELAATAYSSGVSVTLTAGAIVMTVSGLVALALLPRKPVN